jgi:hypothetical protein
MINHLPKLPPKDLGPGLLFGGLGILAIALGLAMAALVIITAGAFIVGALFGRNW